MDNICQAQSSTFINKPVTIAFDFLCDPPVEQTALSPLEEKMIKQAPLRGIGAACQSVIELAARKLNCTTRCIEYAPPQRLVTRLEGDLQGIQDWHLSAENGGTRLQLRFEFTMPEWLPAYLHNNVNATRWSEMLVEQTLARVKTALEQSL